jgi:hypothetical protein
MWYDLMTSDPGAAEGFYSKLIGWSTQPWDGGDMPYTMWMNGEQPVGGVAELSEDARKAGAPPHWLSYISVEDPYAVAARVKELGGAVHHGPEDIPGAGSFAILADPQGAVFAVYRSKDESSGPGGPPGVGEFSWHELATTDHKAAFEFYAELFGWGQHEAMDMGEHGVYQLYGRGELPLGGMFDKTAEMPGPPMWIYYISVPDVNASVDAVRELGGQVVTGPIEVPGGDLIAHCLDPQGAFFALHSTAS